MSVTVAEMAEHIDSICALHLITVGSHSSGGRSNRRGRHIEIRPVKSAVTYAVALHEIGHVLGKDQSKPTLYSEAGAWQWALENALPGSWTDSAEQKMQRSLRSYATWAYRRQYREHNRPVIPEEDHDFWQLAGISRDDASASQWRGVRI